MTVVPGVSAVGVVMNSMLEDMAPADRRPSLGLGLSSTAQSSLRVPSRSAKRALGGRGDGRAASAAKALAVRLLRPASLRTRELVSGRLLACVWAADWLASLCRDSERAVADGRPAGDVEARRSWSPAAVVLRASRERGVVTVVMRPVASSKDANVAGRRSSGRAVERAVLQVTSMLLNLQLCAGAGAYGDFFFLGRGMRSRQSMTWASRAGARDYARPPQADSSICHDSKAVRLTQMTPSGPSSLSMSSASIL